MDKRHPQLNAIRTRDLRLLKVMGYMIKGMTPIIETTNYILKVALKKESFEPAKNLRQSSDGLRMFNTVKIISNQTRRKLSRKLHIPVQTIVLLRNCSVVTFKRRLKTFESQGK